MELAGKKALVTGGAVRVGRALTLALAAAGCDVAIHYGQSAEAARRTQAEAAAYGVRAVLVSADLRQSDAVAQLWPAAQTALGPIDILVNSAAIFPEGDSLSQTDAALFDTLISINLRAPFLLTQALAAHLPPGAGGAIINILDARLFRPAPDHFVYRLAKQGLLSLTEMAAQALAPRIRVNGVALGAILPPPGQDMAYLERLAAERIPLRRPGNLTSVTDSVLYLLRQDFLTGVVVRIDGGEFL